MSRLRKVGFVLCATTLLVCIGAPTVATAEDWAGDLSPISADDWNYERAAHLLERAGFGGTPEEIEKLAAMTPEEAVSTLVDYESIEWEYPEFEESGIYPNDHKFISIQEAAKTAFTTGEAFGIKANRKGPLPFQPGINEFYTLLWSDYGEMARAGQWWGERMVVTPRPFEERMTLFWHDHFATSQDKLHRHRKMIAHIDMLRENATGNMRDFLIAVSQDPAMLVWLDNKDNTAEHPNENYAREIMELFTMGEGDGYTETDIREVARAFTGWTLTPDYTTEPDQGQFIIRPDLHDDSEKTFLGKTGNFDGYDAIDIILEQDAPARFLTNKIYRDFVNEAIDPAVNEALAKQFRESGYEIKPLMRTIFLSKDFYSDSNVGHQIKSPVQLIVSTYRKLEVDEIPGLPDFNELCGSLGQTLFFPPNVAGWAAHKTWINPATLLARGNFVQELLFPPDPMNIEPPDKKIHPGYRKIPVMFPEYEDIVPHIWSNKTQRMEPVSLAVYDQYLAGMDINYAMKMMEDGGGMTDEEMAEMLKNDKGEQKSQMMKVAQGEQYNLAVGVYMGHVEANKRVKPIPRTVADVNISAMTKDAGVKTAKDAVDYYEKRFLSVKLGEDRKAVVIEFAQNSLGEVNIDFAKAETETKLRELVHLILSAPEYQLA